MTIEINKIISAPLNDGWINFEYIFDNLLFTALILTIIIMFILAILYPCKNNTPLYITLKTMFYIFVASVIMLFLHKIVIEEKYEKKHKQELNKSIVEAINRENLSSNESYIPIENNLSQVVGGNEHDLISPEKNINIDTQDSVNDILQKFGV